MTDTAGMALFDTVLGRCGVAWTGQGVAGVAFPEGTDAATRARLLRRSPDTREAAPPPRIAAAISAISALLEQGAGDLGFITLDDSGVDAFEAAVYAAARTLAVGETSTYGALAALAGHPGKARETGRALGRNPFPIIVPCHRILAADGGMGGFSAPGGVQAKIKLLNLERARTGLGAGLFEHLPLAVRPSRPA